MRGKTMGVKDLATERNHRLKTLGLLENFQALSNRIELDEAATAEQARANSYQQSDKTSDNRPEPKTNPEPDAESQQTEKKQSSTQHKPESKQQPESEIDSDSAIVREQQDKHKVEIDEIRQQQSENQQNTKGDKQ